jgi:mannan endo-1,4-beta-mannosidase
MSMNSSKRCEGIQQVSAFLFLTLTAIGCAQITVEYTIETEHGRRPISPYIYGTNFDYITTDNLTVRRMGGNRLTAYNWENNASNAGSDWKHFSNDYEIECIPIVDWHKPGKMVTDFVDQNLAGGMQSMVTLQMAGYVAADKDEEVTEAEKAPSHRWNHVVFRKNGPLCSPPDQPDLKDGCVYMDEFVRFLVTRYGNVASGKGIRFYSMDNEPALWSHTHERIHPNPVTCRQLVDNTRQLAAVVKEFDPQAEICGPVLYGFAAFLSLQDAPDWKEIKQKNSYEWFIDFYLDEMKKYSAADGKRLLDVLDLHWYPEAQDKDGARVTQDRPTETNQVTRMQTPRTLWDPDYTEKSWVGDSFKWALPLLPMVNRSVEKWYPGTKVAFTEYDYGGKNHISGGIAQADVLGIFGKYGVYLATYFGDGIGHGAYTDAAFNLYRNYDGKKSAFGDVSVFAKTSDKINSSIYAAVSDKSGDKLGLIVLNKSLTEEIQGKFRVGGAVQFKTARVWGFDSTSALVREMKPVEKISQNTFTYTIPPLTSCHIVLIPG